MLIATLIQTVVSNPTPFQWALDHMNLVGWPAFVYFAWQAGNYFRGLKAQVTKTVGQIDEMATNHFPHMETSLGKQDVYLDSIDKNIQRMADKL
jgi:hypothetical protein